MPPREHPSFGATRHPGLEEIHALLRLGLLEFRRRGGQRRDQIAATARKGSALVEQAHIDGSEDSANPGSRFSLPRAAGKERGHTHTIRLKLRDMNQLFNSMDPSPFIERDLDDDAEEFIVSWAQECPSNASVRLRIYLDQWPAEDPKELIKTAVHNHFSHRVQIARLDFKRRMARVDLAVLCGSEPPLRAAWGWLAAVLPSPVLLVSMSPVTVLVQQSLGSSRIASVAFAMAVCWWTAIESLAPCRSR